MTLSPKATATSNDRERFELLHAVLRSYYDKFFDTSFKVAGFLFLVGGWVLASESTRSFLHQDRYARFGTVGAVVIGWIAFALTCQRAYTLSRIVRTQLDELGYVEARYYERFQIARPMLLIVVVANTLVSGWLALLIWRLGYAAYAGKVLPGAMVG